MSQQEKLSPPGGGNVLAPSPRPLEVSMVGVVGVADG